MVKVNGAVAVAITAAIGNFLQGWDNATIACAVLYIKHEFHLESHPAVEGLVVAASLIGATIITTFSGPLADLVGRRPMLISSSILYFFGSLMMLWSPNVILLLVARLFDGFGVGLAVTLVPVYISETAPPEIRGQLNTLPQFTGSGGMLISYSMIFVMTLLTPNPNWRIMLGVLSLPSLVYLFLSILYLPESPRWLVSKGKMSEARAVLQMLRGRDDVSGEMALLVEGLGTSGKTEIEEYVVSSSVEQQEREASTVTLYGSEHGLSWVAQPVGVMTASKQGSGMYDQMKDTVVSLLESVHDSGTERGSTLFPNLANILTAEETQAWDEENVAIDDDDDELAESVDQELADVDDDLEQPLLSRHGSDLVERQSSNAEGIGGGWQLAWKWTEKVGTDGVKRSDVKRMYLHEEQCEDGIPGVHAAALVSQSMIYTNDLLPTEEAAIAVTNKPATATAGSVWTDLWEPGVRHALFCGMMIQILQQFSGINGVMYYTPQILDQAGVSVLLASVGLSGDSASILISGVTTLLMLPSIGLAMKLMDVSGRRSLLLWTLPVLILSLLVLVIANLVPMATTLHAALSTISVIVYFCFFVMGFGPIPNILCAEIFPTRVRGVCIAICSMVFWIGDITITYSLPVMLSKVGLAGLFGFYAVVCCLALIFVALKVPETKGLPLEVIIDFFKVGAKGLPEEEDQ